MFRPQDLFRLFSNSAESAVVCPQSLQFLLVLSFILLLHHQTDLHQSEQHTLRHCVDLPPQDDRNQQQSIQNTDTTNWRTVAPWASGNSKSFWKQQSHHRSQQELAHLKVDSLAHRSSNLLAAAHVFITSGIYMNTWLENRNSYIQYGRPRQRVLFTDDKMLFLC